MGIVRGPTSQDDMTRNLPKDTNMNRYNTPAQTPVGGADMAKPAFNRQKQREMTTAAEVGRKRSDLTEPSRYLEVPVLRMPNVFLELAEEARNGEMVDDRFTDRKDVQSQRTGQARPVFVTEILNSTPVVGSTSSRVTNTSTGMTPERNRDRPMIGSGPVGQVSDAEQSQTLGVRMKQEADGPIGPVGRDMLLTG